MRSPLEEAWPSQECDVTDQSQVVDVIFASHPDVRPVSLTGITGEPQYAAYGSTKEAVRALTRHAAREWGRYGIRVNAISPAGFNEGMEPFRANLPAEMQKFVDRMPLGYLGDPLDDIGRAVVALVSDLRYVTGSTLSVDGGLCVLR